MIFKKEVPPSDDPQQVVVTWGNQEQQEAILHSSLFQVASHVTQICLSTGKPLDEVVETYTKAYEYLDAWYRGVPQKEELKRILDTLYPDLPGMEPGETLLPREQEVPSRYMEEAKKRQKK